MLGMLVMGTCPDGILSCLKYVVLGICLGWDIN